MPVIIRISEKSNEQTYKKSSKMMILGPKMTYLPILKITRIFLKTPKQSLKTTFHYSGKISKKYNEQV